jgi:hypothetical protein
VIVSLVVFVLTTVFLLVLTIIFYAGKTEAITKRAEAEAGLARYVRAAERSHEGLQAAERDAAQRNMSVAMHLRNQYQELMRWTTGNPAATFEQAQGTLGVPAEKTVNDAMRDARQTLRERQTELDGQTARLAEREREIAELNARITQLNESHRKNLDEVETRIASYASAATEHAETVRNLQNEYAAAIDRHKEQYEGQVNDLEAEVDRISQERVVLKQRLDELESRVNTQRMKGADPAALVDGRVIEASGGNDQVFINLGRDKRIVLGMTFEVYSDEAALVPDARTGAWPRGKASLQVIKVGEKSSTCKVTRSVPGQPVVRNDVLANAVYDPKYQFKFLVHGKFDVDNDGQASDAEADYIRSQIINWGGTVVSGEQLPGDLDFLVLGVEPPLPSPPAPDAPRFQMDTYIRNRQAHQLYNDLKRQATEAQIPLLNVNRFFILTGYTPR